MKTNSQPAKPEGFSIAPAFAALDQPENEKQLLVADARRQKLPGSAAASRWSLDTLREKLDRRRRPARFSPRDYRKTTVAESPVAVAESPAAVAESPVAVAESPVAVARKRRVEVGDRFTAKVNEKLPFGVIVALPGYKCSALLHVSELAGGGFAARNRRLAAFNSGDEVEVEVFRIGYNKPQTKEEEADTKPGKQFNNGGKHRGKNRDNGRPRIRVSEKRVQDPRLLSELPPATPVKVTVSQLLPFGVIVTIKDGLAAGCDALIHVSQFPGKKGTMPRPGQPGKPNERDAALHRTKLNAELDAEVLSVTRNEQRKGDLDIRLTLRGPEQRAFLARFSPGNTLTGRVIGFEANTYEIGFGRVRGFLHTSDLGHAAPESVRVGGNVHVRVESFDQKRNVCRLTRRGL